MMLENGSIMYSWVQDLFPLSRSIVGPGISSSMRYLERVIGIPARFISAKSGTQIGTWEVPDSWELITAQLFSQTGELICDARVNNLHIWSHSISFSGVVSREILETHLLVGENDEIPYATTYYKKNWGFSISRDTYDRLCDTHYRVNIVTKLEAGKLEIMEYVLPGQSKREILFSTYLCHPSMANNELSGPALCAMLVKILSLKSNYYTLRFLFLPETIGAITYLDKSLKKIKKNTWAAFNVTCVGDDNEWSLVQSRNQYSVGCRIAKFLLRHEHPEYQEYTFLERGSDERQYDSPAVNIPTTSIMRSKYHEYREYHTSRDNLSFVSPEGLESSLDFYLKLIDFLNFEGVYFSDHVGEPFLTSYFETPAVGARETSKVRNLQRDVWNVLAYSNRSFLIDIAESINLEPQALLTAIKEARRLNLIKFREINPKHAK